MAAYEDMIKKVPAVMRQENVLKFYKVVSSSFDDFDSCLDQFERIHEVDYATGYWLNDLGAMVGLARNNDNDSDYRARMKTYYCRRYLVPTLDNLFKFIKAFTGYYPYSYECQNTNFNEEPACIKFNFGNPQTWGDRSVYKWGEWTDKRWLDFGYNFGVNFSESILSEIDNFVSAGTKTKTNVIK